MGESQRRGWGAIRIPMGAPHWVRVPGREPLSARPVEESLRFSARNREISTQMGDQSGLAWAYYDTAWVLHWKGSLAAALDAAQSALTSAQQAGERRVEVFIRCCLCALHAALGDDKTAGGQGRAAIVLADDLGDPIARAGGGHALAYLHIQQEDWDRASELFEEIDGLLADSDN